MWVVITPRGYPEVSAHWKIVPSGERTLVFAGREFPAVGCNQSRVGAVQTREFLGRRLSGVERFDDSVDINDTGFDEDAEFLEAANTQSVCCQIGRCSTAPRSSVQYSFIWTESANHKSTPHRFISFRSTLGFVPPAFGQQINLIPFLRGR